MPKLTVIIVNYNVKFYVEQCLHSLRKALADVDAEVYVVDNHSHDGSVEYLQERFPQVNIIACMHNYGFAYANNVAIKQSQSQYVLLLNPDTFVAENTIQTMLSFMDEHPQAGGMGVQMLGADGQKAMESRRGLPSPMVSFYKMTGLCARFPQSKRFGKYYLSYLPWDAPAHIEVISGACMMVRREAFDKVGLLDEDYFMYGEDIDLSYRILKAGYENWYLPCQILHYKGESTHKSSFRCVLSSHAYLLSQALSAHALLGVAAHQGGHLFQGINRLVKHPNACFAPRIGLTSEAEAAAGVSFLRVADIVLGYPANGQTQGVERGMHRGQRANVAFGPCHSRRNACATHRNGLR